MKYAGEFELKRATDGSAGFDLYAGEDVVFQPGESHLVGTGTRVAIPDGFVGLVFIRSSMAVKRGFQLQNAVGVIDADYRGEIKVALKNGGVQGTSVIRGERIAQLLVVPFVGDVERVDTLEGTERGEGGFGSTGQ